MTDPRLAPLVDRNAKLEDRLLAAFSFWSRGLREPQDITALRMVLFDTQDSDTVRNEVINVLRWSRFAELAKDLLVVLGNPNEKERFRCFAAQHLGALLDDCDEDRRPSLLAGVRFLLRDRHTGVRREALLALVRQRDPVGRETAVQWLTEPTSAVDEKGEVRDLAIRCVHELELKEHIPVIREYLRDRNEVVRIAAIVALSEWGDEASRPAFEEAAASSVVRLRRAGRGGLERLDQAKKATQSPFSLPGP